MEDNRYLIHVGRREKIPPSLEWYKTARGSGHYPLTFNFVFVRQDRHVLCSYCGKWVHYKNLTRDHVYPKSLGGYLKTPCCLVCNVYKEDRRPIEWAIFAYENGLDIAENVYEETDDISWGLGQNEKGPVPNK